MTVNQTRLCWNRISFSFSFWILIYKKCITHRACIVPHLLRVYSSRLLWMDVVSILVVVMFRKHVDPDWCYRCACIVNSFSLCISFWTPHHLIKTTNLFIYHSTRPKAIVISARVQTLYKDTHNHTPILPVLIGWNLERIYKLEWNRNASHFQSLKATENYAPRFVEQFALDWFDIVYLD